jgi:type III restriction enzyme
MFDEDWPRFVVKMATGAGKTKVLSLLMAWSYFHKLYEADSTLARNFLLIAPNIIVLDRLRADFDGLRIFFNDPVLPDNGHAGRNWRDDFQMALHIQDDVRIVRPTGNIFLTNIHRVYLGDVPEPSLDDDDLRDYFLAPFGNQARRQDHDSKTDLGEVVREIDELAVFNDEAHHIHDNRMAWFQCIQDIHHRMLQKDLRLSIQVDVTATPRHDNGAIFVQTVSDYPLVEAIAQNVVKHPVLPDAASRAKLTEHKSPIITEKYADYLQPRRRGVAQELCRAREARQEGRAVRDGGRHQELRRGRLPTWRRFARSCRARCWSSTPRPTARFPRRRPARARTSWSFCASSPTKSTPGSRPTRPSSRC